VNSHSIEAVQGTVEHVSLARAIRSGVRWSDLAGMSVIKEKLQQNQTG
jgi:hypothetical protein